METEFGVHFLVTGACQNDFSILMCTFLPYLVVIDVVIDVFRHLGKYVVIIRREERRLFRGYEPSFCTSLDKEVAWDRRTTAENN